MLANRNILIADDDRELTSVLSEYLTGENFKVTTANNGEEAVSQLREKKFNIAVLDLKMPLVDGFEVLKFIKSACVPTKVIVLTAYADLKSVTECKKLGADDVIEKPYEIGDLLSAIEFVMKK